MKNSVIRRLFTEVLIESLKPSGGGSTLAYPVLQQGVQNVRDDQGNTLVIDPDFSHMVVHLIPDKIVSDTLGGDHRCYTGIFQVTCKAFSETDANLVIEEMAERVDAAFPLNEIFTVPDPGGDTRLDFHVQVISPVTATEAREAREGSKYWQAHAYFTYRADTN